MKIIRTLLKKVKRYPALLLMFLAINIAQTSSSSCAVVLFYEPEIPSSLIKKDL